VTSEQLDEIACAATDLGNGSVDLTSRGNVQLRGLTPTCGGDLADRLYAVGLLPSPAHERARNVLASPLAGVDGAPEAWDVAEVVRRFDEILCAAPDLASLSGRFLVAFDDGRLDVAGLGADVTFIARTGRVAELVLAGAATGFVVPHDDAAAAATVAARAFLQLRDRLGSDAWRIADLGPRSAELVAEVAASLARGGVAAGRRNPGTVAAVGAGRGPSLGRLAGPGGTATLCVGVPLGRADAAAWHALALVARDGRGELRLTPWRSVVVPGLPGPRAAAHLAELERVGLLTDDTAALAGVTACAGRPGCVKARSDVHHDAALAHAGDRSATTTLPVHWSACERRCGHPAGAHVEAVADEGGRYAVRRRAPRDATATAAGPTPATHPAELPARVASARERP
jgi:precorrin-3B synthase